ncbi:hypothetical protein BpHYR1_046088 [Brachionus plicatilis]|uniref:Uncharacterized protein n=1 Tax=Brachionus plicatilis TaxID=10195 RepID=A0A3M7Q811_BRAPC|nr:hypothetical protein BpHYR1_046088 [Brachionus plicatilis]
MVKIYPNELFYVFYINIRSVCYKQILLGPFCKDLKKNQKPGPTPSFELKKILIGYLYNHGMNHSSFLTCSPMENIKINLDHKIS